MYKAEWGTKRTCPKCSARFYDLGNDSPIVCIECAHEWTHEPALKVKHGSGAAQAKPEPAKKVVAKVDDDDDDELAGLETDDIELEDDDDDDDVLGDISLDDDDDDEDVAAVLVPNVSKSDSE